MEVFLLQHCHRFPVLCAARALSHLVYDINEG